VAFHITWENQSNVNKNTFGQGRINFKKSEIENKYFSHLTVIYILN